MSNDEEITGTGQARFGEHSGLPGEHPGVPSIPDACPCGRRGEGTTHGGSSCTSSAVVERKLRP